MAIALVNSVATSPGTTANAYIDVNMPASLVVGNTLVAWVATSGGQTAPSGWTTLISPQGTAGYWIGCYMRVVDGSETATYRWTFTVGNAAAASCIQLSGVDNASPLSGTPTSQNNSANNMTTLTIPSITTTHAGAFLTTGIAQDGINATHTVPTGMTEIAHTGGANTRAHGSAYQALGAAGATGTRAWTMNTGTTRWVGAMVALAPSTAAAFNGSADSSSTVGITASGTVSFPGVNGDADRMVSVSMTASGSVTVPSPGTYVSHGAYTLLGSTPAAYGQNSGLAHSLDGAVLYSHTDTGGGNGPEVYMYAASNVAHLGTLTLTGFAAIDVEDIAVSRYDGKVYVADTGNTPGGRISNLTIAVFDEPTSFTTQTITPAIRSVGYSDGAARDVEALAIHPNTGALYLIAKATGDIWTAPSLNPSAMTVFTNSGNNVGVNPTGADFSPDGKYLAVTYMDDTIKIFDVSTWTAVDTWSHVLGGNNEAIAWGPGGTTLYYANDTQNTNASVVYSVPITYSGLIGIAPVQPTVEISATGSTNTSTDAPEQLSVAITGSGYVNSSRGSVLTASVSINASGTVSTGLDAIVSATVTINASGSVGITGSADLSIGTALDGSAGVGVAGAADRTLNVAIGSDGALVADGVAAVLSGVTIAAAGAVGGEAVTSATVNHWININAHGFVTIQDLILNGMQLMSMKKQTKAFINESPVDLVIDRQIRNPDGAGGYVSSYVSLPPQRFRMIQGKETSTTEVRNVNGVMVKPTLNLIAEVTADIAVGDRLVWDGMPCQIAYITNLQYELIVEVAVR